MKPKAKFHVSNFNGNIFVAMNEECACLLFDLIRTEMEGLTIPQELYALSEKIENQFFHMRKLTYRRNDSEIKPEEIIPEVAQEAVA